MQRRQSVALHGGRGRVPWIVDYMPQGADSFEAKDEGRNGVGSSPKILKGVMIILGVCQLLLPLCTRIRRVGIPIDLPHKEGCSMDVGPPSMTGFPRT